MQARAIFRRKEACLEPSECEIEKVIHLTDSEFARFQQMLLDNYDFLREHAELMRVEGGVTHCLLVVGETFEDGILVNSEGSHYARYAAYFPNAKSFLLKQGQSLAADTSPSAVGGVSAALLAYGEKMKKIVDAAISDALDNHDRSSYIFSLEVLRDANDNVTFMSLGETLAHRKDDSAATQEAISIAERILQNDDVSVKAKGTTSANLLFLYLRGNQDEKAKALIRSLPHIWESREILLPEVYDGEAYIEELRKCIVKVFSFLCQKIDAVPNRTLGETPDYIQLGVDFTPTQSIADMLGHIKAFIEP